MRLAGFHAVLFPVVRRIIISATLLTLALLGISQGAPAAADVSSEQITVEFSPAAEQPECTPVAEMDATGTVTWGSGTFIFTIDAKAPICDEVTAVVYRMPENPGWRWPQHKDEEVKFQVPAGITKITYTFSCTMPQQFDVITGVAPQTIDALFIFGPMHGPLLFENPYSSTYQYPKPGCNTTTTSTSSTSTSTSTTTTTTSTTTTTVAPVVEGVTTTLAPTPTTQAAVPTSVAGVTTTIERDVQPQPVVSDSNETAGENLPRTGSSANRLLYVALGCIAVGAIVFRLSRIRATHRR